MKNSNPGGRRNLLKAAGAGLVAAAASRAGADDLTAREDELAQGAKPVYLWGCAWNHDLPGVFGQACLSFDMRAELNGTGVGTFRDDVYPEVNFQWRVARARRQGQTYTFEGEVVAARDPALVGLPVKIVARNTGDGRAKADIIVGSQENNLVVIAIIAILIGLLLPPAVH